MASTSVTLDTSTPAFSRAWTISSLDIFNSSEIFWIEALASGCSIMSLLVVLFSVDGWFVSVPSLVAFSSVDDWFVFVLSLVVLSSVDDWFVFVLSLVVLSSVDGWFVSVLSLVVLSSVGDWFVSVLSLVVLSSVDDWFVLPSSSVASATLCPAPKINVAPTKIDAVPTVNFLIEYLFNLFGKKSNFFRVFFKWTLPFSLYKIVFQFYKLNF